MAAGLQVRSPDRGVGVPLTAGVFAVWLGLVIVMLGFGSMFVAQAGRVSDFRAFYSAGELLRQSPAQLYDLPVQRSVQDRTIGPARTPMAYYHPAYEALLYTPFTLFRYKAAYLLYMSWNLLLLGACYLLLPAGLSGAAQGVPRMLLVFGSLPVLLCLLQGQNAILVLAMFCATWRCLASRKDFPAGILLGLAVFKLQLVLVFAVLLATRRGARFLAGFLTATAGAALLSLLLTGPGGAMQFVALLKSATPSPDHGLAHQPFALWPKAMPSLYGLLYASGGRLLPGQASFAISLVLSALLLIACVYLVRKVRNTSTAFSLSLVAAVLLSHHIFLYDYPVLLLPIVLLYGRGAAGIVTAYFAWPYVLLAVSGSDWFSFAAILPLALLGCCIAAWRAGAATELTRFSSLMEADGNRACEQAIKDAERGFA